MSDVLMLLHRLPYPPNKGDKVRAFHILKQLAAKHRVHLGCFVDDPDDLQHTDVLDSYCATKMVERLRPRFATIRSAKAFLTAHPLSIPYYFSARMRRWVQKTLIENDVDLIVVYSSSMAQYVLDREFAACRRVMDFVDVDSDKWSQYAQGCHWTVRWIYKREARLLLQFEQQVAEEFDAVAFVSPNEVALFDELSPRTTHKHHAVCNGVASDYFDPDLSFPDPFDRGVRAVVFTGMMNYWPNVDAVRWFAEEIFPEVRARQNAAEFWIVGARPTRDVLSLANIDGVHVTGRVADVRPYLRHAAIAVAPLRIARGVQNKVLEALSMNCQVLCTDQAAQGLHNADEAPLIRANTSVGLISAAIDMLSASEVPRSRVRPRDYVLEHYDWEKNLAWFCADQQAQLISGRLRSA